MRLFTIQSKVRDLQKALSITKVFIHVSSLQFNSNPEGRKCECRSGVKTFIK